MPELMLETIPYVVLEGKLRYNGKSRTV